jgi:serine/threonine protein kinase
MPSGGVFVNSGSYGCVFRPSLPCSNNSIKIKRGMVSKVFDSTSSLREELENNKKIEELDPKNEFTIKSYGSCYTDVEHTKASDRIDKCEHISEYSNNREIVYEDGGIDLYHLTKSKKAVNYDELIPLWIPLVRALVVMKETGVQHTDIKPDNILYNARRHRLVYIDFGLMTRTRDFNTRMIKRFSYKYPYFPPEFKLYDEIFTKSGGMSISYDHVANIIQKNFRSVTGLFETISKYIDIDGSLRPLFDQYIHMSSEAAVKTLAQIREKLDVFSLGISMLETYIYLHKHDKKYCEDFVRKVIAPMIAFDVNQRATPEEALANILEFTKDREVVRKCKLPESKGGYSMSQIRSYAKKHGIDGKTRAEICTAFQQKLVA